MKRADGVASGPGRTSPMTRAFPRTSTAAPSLCMTTAARCRWRAASRTTTG